MQRCCWGCSPGPTLRTPPPRPRAPASEWTTPRSSGASRSRVRGIGIPRVGYFGYSPATDALMEEALKVLKAEGAVVIDPVALPGPGKLGDPELEVLLYEFKADLEQYLRGLGGSAPKTLAELITFNERHADPELRYFGQETFLQAVKKGPLTDPAYRKARAACEKPLPEGGHRRHHVQAQARRAGGAHPGPGLADRPGQRGQRRRRLQHSRGGGRLSPRHAPAGSGARAPGGDQLLRSRLERGSPPGTGLRLRAGTTRAQPPTFAPGAALPAS